MKEKREFILSGKWMSSPFVTLLWLLIAFYSVWRIGQVIMGIVPVWFAFEGFMGIVYVWAFRFRPVKAIVVERDGNVIFDRYLGRCEVNAIYIQRVRPFFHVFKDNFVLVDVPLQIRARSENVAPILVSGNWLAGSSTTSQQQ